MEEAILAFINYIHRTKGSSENTEASYRRDLQKLSSWLQNESGIRSWEDVTATDLNSYMLYMESRNYAVSSVSRCVSSMHAFFRYLYKRGRIKEDVSENLNPPRYKKKPPKILSIEDVDKLLSLPDTTTAKGKRDKAMMELLYASGMRVSELVSLKTDDVNFRYDYIQCGDGARRRVVPFGSAAKDALNVYLDEARAHFVGDKDEGYLFTNAQGHKMTRQGFWKVLKGYVLAADIPGDITPHTLRHSFAAHMLHNGADLKSLQEMLGHADIASTQLYAGSGLTYMRDVYDKAHPRN